VRKPSNRLPKALVFNLLLITSCCQNPAVVSRSHFPTTRSAFICSPIRSFEVTSGGSEQLSIVGQKLTYSNEFCLVTWTFDSGEKIAEEDRGYRTSPAFHSSRSLSAIYDIRKSSVTVTRITDGQIIRQIPATQDVEAISFSHDGTMLLICGGRTSFPLIPTGYAEVWDITTGILKCTVTASEGVIHFGAFSVDDITFATGSGNSTGVITGDLRGIVRIANVNDGKIRYVLESDVGWVSSLAFSPSGNLLAVGGSKPVELWDAQTGQRRSILDSETIGARSLFFALTPDYLIVGAADSVSLWDTASGEKLDGFISPSAIGPIAVSANGRTLISEVRSNQHDKQRLQQWRISKPN
jgi:WD40 repeat protein